MVNRIAKTAGAGTSPHTGFAAPSAQPGSSAASRCTTCRSPCATPTPAQPASTTWPRARRTATPVTASPRSSPACRRGAPTGGCPQPPDVRRQRPRRAQQAEREGHLGRTGSRLRGSWCWRGSAARSQGVFAWRHWLARRPAAASVHGLLAPPHAGAVGLGGADPLEDRALGGAREPSRASAPRTGRPGRFPGLPAPRAARPRPGRPSCRQPAPGGPPPAPPGPSGRRR